MSNGPTEHNSAQMLAEYEVGSKLRRLRLRKKLGLKELAGHTGLSPSMLSQLENGKLVPTLPTLARIAAVFEVGLEYFFTDKRKPKIIRVVRHDQRIRFPEIPDKPDPAYFFECLNFAVQGTPLNAYLADFPLREQEDDSGHSHDGIEFLYVLDGSLKIRFGSEEYLVNSGDSVYFDASEMHSYSGCSSPPAKAVVITMPSRF